MFASSTPIVCGGVLGAMLLSWVYFRRFAVARPPIGVVNLWDISSMIGGIVAVPYLYLILPTWLIGGLLILVGLSILTLLIEPVLRMRALVWAVTVVLITIDVAAAHVDSTRSLIFLAINDALTILIAVGIANLWVQSGMRARHAALLGAFLSFYDLTATSLFPLMGQLMDRLSSLPLAPQLAWPASNGHVVLIGLGDILLASLFPLVLCKAYGRRAGLSAVGITLVTMTTLFAVPTPRIFPVMVVLGPLMVVQYLYWEHRAPERPTHEYWLADPLVRATRPRSPLRRSRQPASGRYWCSGSLDQVNDAFCCMVGYSRDELLAMTFMDITHPDDVTRNLTGLKEVHDGVIDFYVTEKRYYRKDGTLI